MAHRAFFRGSLASEAEPMHFSSSTRQDAATCSKCPEIRRGSMSSFITSHCFSLFHHLGFQRYPRVVVIGGNFLLKDHIPGVAGNEWGDRFNAQNPDDVYKAAKLIDMMVE